MELPSGNRLNPPSSSVSSRRRRQRFLSEGGRVDRISALPDDLLLQVLCRLRCARTAALTSAVARPWRGLWRHLTELSFREIAPDALEAALGLVARPAISLLEIDIPEEHRGEIDPARVSALLRTAARLAPTALVFTACGNCSVAPIEVPVFHRATSIKLEVHNLCLTPPAHGLEFPVLERLSVGGGYAFDTDEFIQRCPRLRVLEVGNRCRLHKIKVHSTTIEELVVSDDCWANGIDIMAPALKQLKLSIRMDSQFSVSFSAPMVENLWWDFSCPSQNVGDDGWRMLHLSLWKKESVNTLRLTIDAGPSMLMDLEDYAEAYAPFADRNFSEEIASLPNFSVLQLHLIRRGHAFGPVVSNLLGICTFIQKLKVDINEFTCTGVCPPNCPCEQPQNWRSQTISLAALEEVEIEGSEGTGGEIAFLKLLFRSAPLMKTMTMKLHPENLPTSRGCKETYKILRENPSVKCRVYCSGGEEVLYP
ncbi:hypothetical protein CFC21_075949 [Triticum aestivum]|uniref:F-box domain-containing protein n=4 Tax=Triticinae TaxID=1648030 RepID=A0A3B6MKP8_WHEAT|nr:uncharacterized protein LOC123124292 [Triticum aestivum]KAF7070424.1 hypothetical protein CFC21_075949 [Triticum aestivum]